MKESKTLENFLEGKPPFIPEKTGYVMTEEDERKIEEDMEAFNRLFKEL